MKTIYGISGRIAMAALVVLSLFSMVGSAVALSNSGGGSWQYYKEITVSENSGSTLTAYQVLVQLSASNFPTNTRSDGADIRFTDASNNELSYWIESWDYSGRSAKIWVKVPSITASAATTIRMYYGNPSAGSSSSGDATFDLYDDFSGTSLDVNKWDSSGTISISNGEISLYGLARIKSKAEFGENILEETRSKAGGGVGYYIGFRDSADTKGITIRGSNGADPFWWDAGNGIAWSGGGVAPYDTVYHLWRLERNGVSSAKIYQDGALKVTVSTNLPSGSLKAFLLGGEYPTGTYFYTYVDWVRIRKYASSEPTLTLGGEQQVTTPDTTLPVISISAPSNGQSFTTNTAAISGTASDNVGLSKVEVKVGTGSWQQASGTGAWSASLTLASGTNTIYARATDTSGNINEASVTVTYNPPGSITVTTNLADASFALTGASSYSGSGTSWSTTTAPAGTYTITYGTVAGNNAPPSETKTLTAGGSIAFSGTYTLTPTVTVTPTVTSTTVPAVKLPSLTVSHTTLTTEPEVGEEALMTVTVQNSGDAIAKNIRLTEQIPSSISVSFIDGATSNTGNLIIWNGELAPNRIHAITHTLKILEKKERAIPVIIRYEDEAGNQRDYSTTVYVSAQATATPTPVQTKEPTPYTPASTPRIPGFTGLLVLIGLVAAILLVRRR